MMIMLKVIMITRRIRTGEKLSQSVKNKESKNQRLERSTTQEDTVQRSRAT